MLLSDSSIRMRLTLWNTVVLMIVLGIVSLGSYLFIRSRLESMARSRLENGYSGVAAVVGNSGGDLDDVYHLGQQNLFQLSRDGRVVYQTLTWQEIRPGPPTSQLSVDIGAWQSPEGARYWLKRGEEPLTGLEILFALDVTETISYIGSLAIIFLAVMPFALVLSVLGGYFLAGRALSPFEVIAEKAAEINAENLSERLPVRSSNDEIGRLATVFNDTLARLDGSFQRLRRFTSDASHELRTPLTSIRSVGEVALQGSLDRESCREAIGSMLEETERLTHLVDNLLALARGDDGKANLAVRPMDVSALVRDVVEELRILAEEKRQILTAELPHTIEVTADEPSLRQAVVNVLHNAIRYSPEGSPIGVRTAIGDHDSALIEITDDGPGIPNLERDKVFERFYRIAGNKAGVEGGAGLGLSIARWAVEANRGTICFVERSDPGTCCRITLPGGGEL